MDGAVHIAWDNRTCCKIVDDSRSPSFAEMELLRDDDDDDVHDDENAERGDCSR